ncbi:MAG: hypothetical protein U0169_24890 [Polyangiaceae bacterium]
MHFREIFAFDVVHGGLPWPWITFASGGVRFAALTKDRTITAWLVEGETVRETATFALPEEAHVPTKPTGPDVTPRGLVAFALGGTGTLLATLVEGDGGSHVAVRDATTERARIDVVSRFGVGHVARAIAFDRRGTRIWLALEGPTETVVALLDAGTLAIVGEARSAAFPRPSLHELHVHPVDDAVLLLAACGEDGTFGRVVGFAGDTVSPVPGALDTGSVSAGFVGYSARGARVFLAEADEIRTHAWPGMEELASVHLADEFVSSYAGAVVGDVVLVDGEDVDSQEDAVMQFDVSATVGHVIRGVVPAGMWAGRVGERGIVTVGAKGDPSEGRVHWTSESVRRVVH